MGNGMGSAQTVGWYGAARDMWERREWKRRESKAERDETGRGKEEIES